MKYLCGVSQDQFPGKEWRAGVGPCSRLAVVSYCDSSPQTPGFLQNHLQECRLQRQMVDLSKAGFFQGLHHWIQGRNGAELTMKGADKSKDQGL